VLIRIETKAGHAGRPAEQDHRRARRHHAFVKSSTWPGKLMIAGRRLGLSGADAVAFSQLGTQAIDVSKDRIVRPFEAWTGCRRTCSRRRLP
jgi:hypothetical protein